MGFHFENFAAIPLGFFLHFDSLSGVFFSFCWFSVYFRLWLSFRSNANHSKPKSNFFIYQTNAVYVNNKTNKGEHTDNDKQEERMCR